MNTVPSPLHVVLGAGPAGTAIAAELAARGLAVRHVDRKPIQPADPRIETRQADLSTAAAAIEATDGAAVIYHAVNVAYHLQVPVLPGIADAVLAAAGEVLATTPGLVPDYLALTDPDLGPAPAAGPARLLAAVRAGGTRLLDNTAVTLGEPR